MRAVVQRVAGCRVEIEGKTVGSIERGLLAYIGIGVDDGPLDADYIAEKVVGLRIFQDSEGKMNRSVLEAGGGIVVVSQFTLLADARKGRRPSYDRAAPPALAKPLYERLLTVLSERGIKPQSGVFGASMDVVYTNRGPVTVLLDSKRQF